MLAAATGIALAQSPTPPKQLIDLASARQMIDAAEGVARKLNASVGIAVVDANGDLVMSVRLDGAPSRGVTSSQGKARAALLFGVPTKQVQDAIAAGHPMETTLTAPLDGVAELTTYQGGLPIVRDGRVIGAIGVGGSTGPGDERIAQAGLAALVAK